MSLRLPIISLYLFLELGSHHVPQVSLRRELLLLQLPLLELQYVPSRFLHNFFLLTIKFESFFDSF